MEIASKGTGSAAIVAEMTSPRGYVHVRAVCDVILRVFDGVLFWPSDN
jgi:hypothetical protein